MTSSSAATRSLGRRLVVAAALFMPLVRPSIAFWLVPTLRFPGWQWLVIALAAPVVGWAAWPFYVGAVRSCPPSDDDDGHPGLDRHSGVGRLVPLRHVLAGSGSAHQLAPLRAVARERWLHLPRRGRRSNHLPLGRPLLRGDVAATGWARPASVGQLVDQGRLGARGRRHRTAPPDLRARRRRSFRGPAGRAGGGRRHRLGRLVVDRPQRHDRRVHPDRRRPRPGGAGRHGLGRRPAHRQATTRGRRHPTGRDGAARRAGPG